MLNLTEESKHQDRGNIIQRYSIESFKISLAVYEDTNLVANILKLDHCFFKIMISGFSWNIRIGMFDNIGMNFEMEIWA